MTGELATVHTVRDLVERLRESWGWLWLLVVPGPERRPGRAVDENQAEILEARGRTARTYRALALREGRGALAATAAPARLDIIDAQAAVHRQVVRVAGRVAKACGKPYGGGRPEVVGAVVDVLDWLTAGAGTVWVVDTVGVTWRAGAVDELHDNRHSAALADVARLLRTADEIARSAAGVVAEPVRPIEHRCPACGNRSLQLHHPGRAKSLWTVSCVRRTCLCIGSGCGCLKRDRRPGLPHVWTRGELSGPYGLASAVDRARLAGQIRVRSGAAGMAR